MLSGSRALKRPARPAVLGQEFANSISLKNASYKIMRVTCSGKSHDRTNVLFPAGEELFFEIIKDKK